MTRGIWLVSIGFTAGFASGGLIQVFRGSLEEALVFGCGCACLAAWLNCATAAMLRRVLRDRESRRGDQR